MTKLAIYSAKMGGRLSGRLTLGIGLTTAVLLLGVANANAGVKADFADPNASIQVAALESQKRLVGIEDLSNERAKGFTPGTLSTPGDDSEVAVILWDDAWSELQRRTNSATTTAAAGSNASTNIAGSSGTGSN